jgi:hypothetical protein
MTLSEPFLTRYSSNWRDCQLLAWVWRLRQDQTKYLVDLPPFLGSLVCETLVYQRHDLVEELAIPISMVFSDGKSPY